jgi:hypothetical protein
MLFTTTVAAEFIPANAEPILAELFAMVQLVNFAEPE